MNTICDRNYKKLMKLAPDLWSLTQGDALKSQSSGLMDLHLDVLSVDQEAHKMVIALSHYYQHPSGDMIPDPDMELRIDRSLGMVEALTYQDSIRFQSVYLEDGRYYPKLKKELNSFLGTWLRNCLSQGHKLQGVSQE